uniref:Cytochrome c1 ABC transporter channel subunit n=1 Tax=Closterium baillyanum TaxID=1416941 RepID=U5YE53_9VIRI|nr:cytochrome c1 ABC transporter channel subunit [Closterium baillyanum]AGZ90268.1 cytochrome c1 ABC transporter channel subunit [Closterium baillyanum]
MKINLIILRLCVYEIRLNLFTIAITFCLFALHLITIPLFIGLWQELLFQFHLGIIWTCILFSFLPERFLKMDLQDGTLEFYFLSSFPLQPILLSKLLGYWLLKISGILCCYPLLAFFYRFAPSPGDFVTLILGSFLFMLICGIHSCLTLSLRSSDWNSLQYLTTLPTLLPLIMLCTYIQTEKFHLLFLIGYLGLFFLIYSIIVSVTLRNVLSQ